MDYYEYIDVKISNDYIILSGLLYIRRLITTITNINKIRLFPPIVIIIYSLDYYKYKQDKIVTIILLQLLRIYTRQDYSLLVIIYSSSYYEYIQDKIIITNLMIILFSQRD